MQTPRVPFHKQHEAFVFFEFQQVFVRCPQGRRYARHIKGCAADVRNRHEKALQTH